MLRELLETDVSTFYKLDIHAGRGIIEFYYLLPYLERVKYF